MKKIISILTILVLCFAMVVPMSVSAASASATLSGPGTVRAGDTITLNFNLNGSGIYGASGTLSYDSSQVTLSKTTQKIGSPWAVEFNGNNFVAYDNNLSSPINSNKTLFTVTFKVKSVAPGTNIKISYTNVKASDGSADKNLGTISYSKTVAAPLATDNNLASLIVSNATISPAFSAGTTSYTASVPFEVSKLNVTAKAADSKAKVSVNSPTLTPSGTTKVTITVTAENGSKKTYTISVKRAADPNYVASGNNNLSNISVDGFLLSPVFDANTDKYVVWLPYETENVTVSGSAQDSKASVAVEGGSNLVAGQDNEVTVICTAENGDKKTYTVVVKRAPAHDGSVDNTPDTDNTPSEPNDSNISTPDDTNDNPSNDVSNNNAPNNTGIELWLVIVVGVAALVIGGAAGFVVKGAIQKKK